MRQFETQPVRHPVRRSLVRRRKLEERRRKVAKDAEGKAGIGERITHPRPSFRKARLRDCPESSRIIIKSDQSFHHRVHPSIPPAAGLRAGNWTRRGEGSTPVNTVKAASRPLVSLARGAEVTHRRASLAQGRLRKPENREKACVL